MRRGIGVKAVKAKQQDKEAFNALGKEIQEANVQHVTALMATFKDSLEDFARKHKKEINASPVFRSEFTKMCAKIGVDPLASNKGFWAQVLGVGDFYYELAVQVIEICLLTRPSNGGLMSLQDLTQRLRRRRKLDKISEEDVRTAIQKVHLLGAGFQLLQSGKNTLVVSVPTELSSDHAAILQEAQRVAPQCSVTLPGLRASLGWEERRIRTAVDLMMQGGMMWVDAPAGDGGPQAFWVPSLWAQARQAASGVVGEGEDGAAGAGV